jgi:hypothetical protein
VNPDSGPSPRHVGTERGQQTGGNRDPWVVQTASVDGLAPDPSSRATVAITGRPAQSGPRSTACSILGTSQRRGMHEGREYHDRGYTSILEPDEFLDSAAKGRGPSAENEENEYEDALMASEARFGTSSDTWMRALRLGTPGAAAAVGRLGPQAARWRGRGAVLDGTPQTCYETDMVPLGEGTVLWRFGRVCNMIPQGFPGRPESRCRARPCGYPGLRAQCSQLWSHSGARQRHHTRCLPRLRVVLPRQRLGAEGRF